MNIVGIAESIAGSISQSAVLQPGNNQDRMSRAISKAWSSANSSENSLAEAPHQHRVVWVMTGINRQHTARLAGCVIAQNERPTCQSRMPFAGHFVCVRRRVGQSGDQGFQSVGRDECVRMSCDIHTVTVNRHMNFDRQLSQFCEMVQTEIACLW